MKARRALCMVAMSASEGMIGYINRMRNLSENLKAMGGEATEMDVTLSVLNGLTSNFENLLVALDSKGEKERSLDFFKRRILQEERHQADKSPAVKRTGDMALVGASDRGESRPGDLSKVECFYCRKLGLLARNSLVLKARNESRDRVAAIAADDGSDGDDAICLVCDANDDGDIAKSWLIESAASPHMCWMSASFEDYQKTTTTAPTSPMLSCDPYDPTDPILTV